MKAAYVLAGAGLVIMVAALYYGFTSGEGWDEVRALVAYPWFNVSLVDVYVGFALFCGWVWYREGLVLPALLWTIAILTLGNAITCLYVLIALGTCGSDWRRFWLGARASRQIPRPTQEGDALRASP